MQKSQWKIDFLPIFSPIFQNFCHFMHLWNTKFFGVGLGGVVHPGLGGGEKSLQLPIFHEIFFSIPVLYTSSTARAGSIQTAIIEYLIAIKVSTRPTLNGLNFFLGLLYVYY